VDLVPGRSGTVHKNWLAERGKDSRAEVPIATLDPLPRGSKNAIAWPSPRTQPACSWDGQSLVIEAGENCPSDARGEALPVVVLAPRA
jgi:hypothetical protein